MITVHPDELSFEAFSSDESSYARVALKYDLFASIEAFECGTTNVDFSRRLHRQIDGMRSYRTTRFDVDPSGFAVTSPTDGAHREKKSDMPESWVNGFLQVQSVMTLSLTRIRLSPVLQPLPLHHPFPGQELSAGSSLGARAGRARPRGFRAVGARDRAVAPRGE